MRLLIIIMLHARLTVCSQMSKEAGLTADDLSDEEVDFGSDMDGEFDDVISDQEEDGGEAGFGDGVSDEEMDDDDDEPAMAPRRKAVRYARIIVTSMDCSKFGLSVHCLVVRVYCVVAVVPLTKCLQTLMRLVTAFSSHFNKCCSRVIAA